MQFDKSPFYGQVVEFQDKWGRTFQGVVVKTSTYGHCPGANHYTVYSHSPDSSRLYGISLGSFKVVGPGGEQAIQRARDDYRQYLQQYPIWRERIAAGQALTFW